jgi:hypothetical protein
MGMDDIIFLEYIFSIKGEDFKIDTTEKSADKQ